MSEEVIALINKILNGRGTSEDVARLKAWVEESNDNKAYFVKSKRLWHIEHSRQVASDDVDKAREDFITFMHNCRHNHHIATMKRIAIWAAAASVLLVVGLSVGKGIYDKHFKEMPLAKATIQANHPTAQAELMLSNGEKRDIVPNTNTAIDNLLGSVEGTINNRDCMLDFSEAKEAVDITSTVRIPVSGYYKLTLSDGTRVTLNSSSELIFPVTFANNVRQVYLKGEAYFDVAHDASRQFIVSTEGGMDVVVHGTAFNINAYNPHRVLTTLVRGKVSCRIQSTGHRIEMKPNQTVEFDIDHTTSHISTADPYVYTAWTEGKFVFDNQKIEDIMDRLSLWYNINVEYDNDETRQKTFTGILSRSSDPNDILKTIEATTEVKFFVRGNTIIVK